MNAQGISALVVAGIAGYASASGDPVRLDPSDGNVRHAGHIYFNIATGEKITSLIDVGDVQQPVVGEPGTEIWIADTRAQCADQGYSTEYFFGLDDPTGSSSLSINAICFDWGDIPFNTVVDCVQVHWVSNHEDSDTNSDGIADGIEGLAATWLFWDGVNGSTFDFASIAYPIISFSLFNLQGEFPTDTASLAFWTADIDLGGSFGTSLTFEIGDDDSDLQGASVHNARRDLLDEDSDSIPDIDPDLDGLADWGWSVQFIQPGVADVDNADGDDDWSTGIDGNLSDLATAGLVFGSPTPGHAEFDSIEDQWHWVSDGPTAGVTEDSFMLGWSDNPDGSGGLGIAGTFWFGGLDCTPGSLFGYTPAAHFQTVLYGTSACGVQCPVDLPAEVSPGTCPHGDGVLNFIDITNFLSLYGQGNLIVDFAGNPDGSPDGVLNFLDVTAFLSMFAAGCP